MNYFEMIRILKEEKIIRFIYLFSLSLIILFLISYYNKDIKEFIDFNIYLLKIKMNLYIEY